MANYDNRSKRPGRNGSDSSRDARPAREGGKQYPRQGQGPRPPAPAYDARPPREGGKQYPRQGQGPRPAAPAYDARPPREEREQHPPQGQGPRPATPAYSQRPPSRPAGVIRRAVPEVVHPPFEEEAPLPRENLLVGRNPIREAIKSGRDMERLLVARGELSGSAREIVAMAREQHIVVQTVDRARLDEIEPHHQGMIAFTSAFRYATVEDMLSLAKERGEPPLLVILDGISDPHNLGAIIRTAECAGAHGVIVPQRRAVGLTPAAVKASAGAVEYLPVARVGNLTRLIETLKAQGLWIAAADTGGEPYTGVDLTGPLALVIGGEGGGVSRLVLENCDRRAALPMAGKLDSLNASVAAGVLLYEIRRQRA